MSPELSQKLANAVDAMPAFPQSVQKIVAIAGDVNSAPKNLIEVINKDPVMTVKVLKVVNSAHYGLGKQITSIDHAVVYMGFNTIKNLALSIAAIGVLPKNNDCGFDVQQYLLHSLSTATIAKQLASRIKQADAMDCFIAGLLHDFGKVVFAQFMPQEFKQALHLSQTNHSVSLHTALQSTIGVDHALVGSMLVEKWRFAPHLVEAIRHQNLENFKDNDVIACVFAANQISKKLRLGFGGNYYVEEFPASVKQRLQGSLDEVIAALGDLHHMVEEANAFVKI